MTFYYYQIVNLINHKKYIGLTQRTPQQRFKEHKNNLNNKKHVNYNLQKDWDLYGESNFKFEVICKRDFKTVDEGFNYEHELVPELSDSLYNLKPGGYFNPMNIPEIKQKMIKTKQEQTLKIFQLEEEQENIFYIKEVYPSQKNVQKTMNMSQSNIRRGIINHTSHYGYFWITETQLLNFEKNGSQIAFFFIQLL